MSTRTTTAVTLGALAILTLTACAGGPAVNEPSTPKASVTREQAEERTGDVQRKIIDAFPSGAVADDSTNGLPPEPHHGVVQGTAFVISGVEPVVVIDRVHEAARSESAPRMTVTACPPRMTRSPLTRTRTMPPRGDVWYAVICG